MIDRMVNGGISTVPVVLSGLSITISGVIVPTVSDDFIPLTLFTSLAQAAGYLASVALSAGLGGAWFDCKEIM
ncbi:MAG: hypothetical protein LBD58_00905 [Treponema sp.]|nr:hypothetical protein [Treponema sp.]